MQEQQALIRQLRESVYSKFPDSARRQQFDSHLATVEMTIEHMHAEHPDDATADTAQAADAVSEA